MPKKNRLSRRELVGLAALPRRRVSGSLFSAAISPLSEGTPARVACAVSKKVSPKAVVRNLVKRRARAALRELPIAQLSVAIVLTARRGAAEASYAEVREDIHTLLRRAL